MITMFLTDDNKLPTNDNKFQHFYFENLPENIEKCTDSSFYIYFLEQSSINIYIYTHTYIRGQSNAYLRRV